MYSYLHPTESSLLLRQDVPAEVIIPVLGGPLPEEQLQPLPLTEEDVLRDELGVENVEDIVTDLRRLTREAETAQPILTPAAQVATTSPLVAESPTRSVQPNIDMFSEANQKDFDEWIRQLEAASPGVFNK
jgi:hypothetical protein